MKTYYLFFILFLISCSGSKKTQISDSNETAWVNAFKDKTFVSCLKESYKNDSIFMMIDKVDLYNPYDGFYTIDSFVTKADSTGRYIAKNIPPTNYRDYGKSNYYMATCLHYYKSMQLDSIAKAAYKNYVQNRGDE